MTIPEPITAAIGRESSDWAAVVHLATPEVWDGAARSEVKVGHFSLENWDCLLEEEWYRGRENKRGIPCIRSRVSKDESEGRWGRGGNGHIGRDIIACHRKDSDYFRVRWEGFEQSRGVIWVDRISLAGVWEMRRKFRETGNSPGVQCWGLSPVACQGGGWDSGCTLKVSK